MNNHETRRNEEGGMNNGGERMETGLRKGIRAFFDVDEITIGFWGSAWSGREIVTVEDRVVSRKRNLRFVSEHRFSHAGIDYRIVFRVISLLRGKLRIELHRDGVLIDSDQVSSNQWGIDPATGEFSVWRLLWKLAPFFVVGMLTGAAAAFLVDFLTGG
ncbi:MAG: hypothetical protein U5L08_02000 [Xanthomonadales bacterium]|nr:hypothetical protein [Xanthomonadales bacterium]